MRIVFIENKHVTRTWEAITPRLMAAGDEVHWIVQNRLWTPRVGTAHIIPAPARKDLRSNTPDYARVADMDRGIHHFAGDDRHYLYYAERIGRILDEVAPDVVIGESTLFHEHLAILASRQRNIPYLFPTGVRYPIDRIGFLVGDTQEVVFGSGEELPSAQLDRLLEIYARRGSVPLFYAHLGATGPLARARSVIRALGKAGIATASRWSGERFNTPSVLHKAFLERRQKRLMREWDTVAARKAELQAPSTILFPLQMLPESTLDCWGYEWRDQVDTLRRVADAADENTVVLVKTNPVPRYEVSPAMLALVSSHPRIRPLPAATKMDDVFWSTDLIVTVTGTVAIEALLTGRPFATFAFSAATRFAPERTLVRPEAVGQILDRIRAGSWKVADVQARRRFLQHQVAISHQAVMADYYYYPQVLDPENLDRLARALGYVRQALNDGSARRSYAAALARADEFARNGGRLDVATG